MSAKLDFSKFTFSAEQIRDLKDLIYDEVIKSKELNTLYTVFEDVVYDKEVGFITKGGLVGIPRQKCGGDPQPFNIGTRMVKWEPKSWEVFLEDCADDLENTAAVYCQKKGVNMSDLTDTDYMAIILEMLIAAILEFVHRTVWFADENITVATSEDVPTAAATEQTTGEDIVGTVYEGVTAADAGAVKCALANKTVVYLAGTAATGKAVSGKTYYSKDTEHKTTIKIEGDLAEGTDPRYFKVIKAGFFKQMQEVITAKPTRGVTIEENNGESYAAQVLSPNNVQGYLQAAYYQANVLLRGKGVFYVTQSVYDAYEKSLAGVNLETMYKNLVDGQRVLTYNGLALIAMPEWDEIIAKYYNDGVKCTAPHRIVYTQKEVLAVGLDSAESLDDVKYAYDIKSDKVYTRAGGKMDAKLANPDLFTLAW